MVSRIAQTKNDKRAFKKKGMVAQSASDLKTNNNDNNNNSNNNNKKNNKKLKKVRKDEKHFLIHYLRT